LYVPSTSPVAASDVSVLAAVIDTWFHCESAASVMLALFVTVTVSFTRYAVPVFVLRTVADAAALIRAVVTVTVGVVPSSGIAAALAVEVLVVESLNVAVTVNVYEVPLVRPVTVQLVVADVHVKEPGVDVAV